MRAVPYGGERGEERQCWREGAGCGLGLQSTGRKQSPPGEQTLQILYNILTLESSNMNKPFNFVKGN